MSEIDLHPGYDTEHERRVVEMQARHDATVDWSAVDERDRPPHGALRAIDQRTERQVAALDQVHRAEEHLLHRRIAAARTRAEHTESIAATARAAEVDSTRRRDDLAAVLTGHRRGDDEGHWADRGRMSERAWLAGTLSALLYLSAAVVDGGLNYLAFRIMGVSPVETVILAAGVVLVAVLLPKQIGEMLAVRRRGGRIGPRQRLLVGVATAIWAIVSVFVALVRTSYLMLPGGVGTGAERPSLPALAGVDPIVLTVGWLAVAVAVGLVVMLHAMRRYNPHVRSWHTAVREAARARVEHADRRNDADAAHHELDTTIGAIESLHHNRDSAIRACRAFGDELKEHYRAAFARHIGAPERRHPVDPPAALPPTDRWTS